MSRSRSASMSGAMWCVIWTRQVADTGVAVECGAADPQGAAGGIERLGAPPAHMMELVGDAADVLLEREVMFAAEET